MNTPQHSGEISLPELPDRYRGSPTEVNGHPLRLFAAHQMQAYARAAILADRERSAGAVPAWWTFQSITGGQVFYEGPTRPEGAPERAIPLYTAPQPSTEAPGSELETNDIPPGLWTVRGQL